MKHESHFLHFGNYSNVITEKDKVVFNFQVVIAHSGRWGLLDFLNYRQHARVLQALKFIKFLKTQIYACRLIQQLIVGFEFVKWSEIKVFCMAVNSSGREIIIDMWRRKVQKYLQILEGHL